MNYLNRESIIVAVYLTAIVAANLIITAFGPEASVVTAFVFIGLDLSTRDFLHEAWDRRGLIWKMALLIASGSLISYGLNKDAGPIALASFCAFAAAGVVDTIVYYSLRTKDRLIRINGSNVFSSITDSILFPVIAFGMFPGIYSIIAWQVVAKIGGGAIWGYVIYRIYKKAEFSNQKQFPPRTFKKSPN